MVSEIESCVLWSLKVEAIVIWLNFIIVQQVATYSVYYISVGSSTCFGCWHTSSGAGTAVITSSGTGQRMVVDPVNQCQKM